LINSNIKLGLTVVLYAFFTGAIANAESGSNLWLKTCSACHGVDGSGSTPMGKRMLLPDFRDEKVQKSLSDEMIQSALLNGLKRNKDGMLKIMPAYKHLSEPTRLLLQKHLRTFLAAPKPETPPTKKPSP
jgi:mono/diheme cytochrome c family protein